MLSGALERGRVRTVATSIGFSEREEIKFRGIVGGLRLHDRKVPSERQWCGGAVVMQTRGWAMICKTAGAWRRAMARLLVEGDKAPEAYVYYADFE